jgi:hypothetical protein
MERRETPIRRNLVCDRVPGGFHIRNVSCVCLAIYSDAVMGGSVRSRSASWPGGAPNAAGIRD